MTIRVAAGRDHHDLGGRRRTCSGRPVEIGQELLAIAATEGDWVLEVEVPDDDMGPVLAAQSKLETRDRAGKKPAGTDARRPTSSRRPTPSTATPATSSGSPPRPSWSSSKHVVKVTVGFSDEVRNDFLDAEPGAAARGRGPGPGRLRRGPAGLRPAPRRRPRLLRDRPVPLAVPAMKPSRLDRLGTRSDGSTRRMPVARRRVDRPASIRLTIIDPRPGGSPCPSRRKPPPWPRASSPPCPSRRSPRTPAAPRPPSRARDARPRRAGHARLDREVRRRRPPRGGHRDDGAPDRHAGREGRADRLPPQRDRRADRRARPSSPPSNVAAEEKAQAQQELAVGGRRHATSGSTSAIQGMRLAGRDARRPRPR